MNWGVERGIEGVQREAGSIGRGHGVDGGGMGCEREGRRDSAHEVGSGGKYHAERPRGQAAKKGY